MRIVQVVLAAILVSSCCLAQNPLDQILNRATQSTLSNDKVTAGLKEALSVSTSKAVAATGKPDGFLKNEAIRILLPDKLRTAGRTLRLIGMGKQLDDLEVGMNRAAEQAAPQAKRIFLTGVTRMTFDDARRILSGGDTAATDYFREKSSAELSAAFAPIVHQSLQNVGVVRQYSQIAQSSVAAPMLQRFDLDNYVVGKTLDGLFYMLGQEEKKIRKDPAAQSTALLKEVFGARLARPR